MNDDFGPMQSALVDFADSLLVDVLAFAPMLVAMATVIFAMPYIFRLFKVFVSGDGLTKRERHERETLALRKRIATLESERAAASSQARLTLLPPKKIKADQDNSRCDCILCQPDKYALREVGLTPPAKPTLRNMGKYWDSMLEKKS